MKPGLHWFPTDIDPNTGEVELVNVVAGDLREPAFLDERWRPTGERARRPLAQIASEAVLKAPHLVFHTAFCGSTLLARALDVPGKTLVLREPGIMVRLSNLKREGHPMSRDGARWRQLVASVLGLIGGVADADELVAIKPSNLCNNLIDDALAAWPERKALLLYSDLRSFLVSVLKKGEQGRGFVRRLCLSFSLDVQEARNVAARELLQMTDLQMAAAVWLMQMHLFHRAVSQRNDGRVRTLDAEQFLKHPRPTLAGIDGYLGLALGQEAIDAIAEGPVFRRNSKTDQAFDLTQRNEEARAVEAAFGADIDRTVTAAARGWHGLLPPALPLACNLGGADAKG